MKHRSSRELICVTQTALVPFSHGPNPEGEAGFPFSILVGREQGEVLWHALGAEQRAPTAPFSTGSIHC